MNSKRTDILFIFPTVEILSRVRFSYHTGVGYIIALLRQKHIDARVFEWDEPINLPGAADEILTRYMPRMIGFTCYDGNYYLIKAISRVIKEREPSIKIILGGPTPSFLDGLLMEDNPYVDVCVRGEGEHTTYELIKTLDSGGNLINIRGITFRESSKITRTGDRPFVQELDSFPSPYLEGVSPLPADRRFMIGTSRGCIYRCTYCQFSAMFGGKIRYYPIGRVLAELEAIGRMAARDGSGEKFVVEFIDDAFCLDKERVHTICSFIRDHELFKNAEMACQTRGDTVNREILELLYGSGFRRIGFGLESGVPEILKKIKKARQRVQEHFTRDDDGLEPERVFLEKVKQAVFMAKEIGFHTNISIIIGLPRETFEQGKQTIAFVEKLAPHRYIHNYFTFYPGTELFNSREENLPGRINLISHGGMTGSLFKTIYSYDVFSVPILPYAACDSDVFHLVQLTGGNTHVYSSPYPVGIFLDEVQPDLDHMVFTWLRDIISFSTRVYLLGEDYREEQFFERRKHCAQAGAPVFLFFFTRRRKSQAPGFPFAIHPENYDILYAPFPGPYPVIHEPSRELVNLGINNEADMSALCRLAQQAGTTGFITLDGSFVNAPFAVEDGCRWNCWLCPAGRMSRFFINNDLAVIPCRHGKAVGKIGDPIDDIKNNIEEYLRVEIEKRGCHACEVRDFCSQCLFTYPVEPVEYCRLRRQFPWLGEIFILMEIACRTSFPGKDKGVPISMRVYTIPRHQPKEQSRVQAGQRFVKQSLREIIYGGECYIYDLDRQKARQVSQVFMDFIICLKQGDDLDTMVAGLAEKYRVSSESMEKTVKKAMQMAFDLGYMTTTSFEQIKILATEDTENTEV
jgi:radical SAM protein with 4Fe4S-binding SPASM domain